MKDFYGELVQILTVTIGSARYTLFRGDWYDHQSVRAHDRSKTYFVTEHERVENNKDPFAAPEAISGQVFVAPHPLQEGVKVIFDRTADFLECEVTDDENEGDASSDEDTEPGAMPEAPTPTRGIGEEEDRTSGSDPESEEGGGVDVDDDDVMAGFREDV